MSSKIKGLLDKAREFYQNNPKKAKMLIVGVIGLGLISYGAMDMTSRPGFCVTCHEMKPMHDNWKDSVHAEVSCYDCHMAPGIAYFVTHKIKALNEVRLHFTVYNKPNAPEIHAKELKPINDACTKCHSLNREYSFSGDIRVPHKLHIDKGLTCPTCHSRVVHGAPEERKPKMEVCLTCHNGKKAPDSCETCHTKKSAPASHKQDNWYQVHGQQSKTENCGKCHNWRPDWCMQCHQKKPKSHEVRWRSNHGAKAAADRASCNACHKQDFCMRCHGIQP